MSHSARVLFSPADPVCRRAVIRHRLGEDLQILLPETQNKSHKLLSRGCVGGSDWLANHWSCVGDLWILPLIQVLLFISFKLSHDIVCWQLVAAPLLVLSPLALCLDRGFFPVAVGFIRRVPVLGSILNLPGISTVSTRPQ